MPDMLVKLYELPALEPALQVVRAQGVAIRRALLPEKPVVLQWVQSVYPTWAAEVDTAFARNPVTCMIAVRQAQIVGFAVHDAVCKNFFGPMAVAEGDRAKGVGRALTLITLHAQRDAGYAYAIIGGVGPEAFYAKVAGATTIPGSAPGIYAGMLRP
jgi:hypothetical protein